MSSHDSRVCKVPVPGGPFQRNASQQDVHSLLSSAAPSCEFCSKPLTIHEQASGKSCSRLECKTKLTLARKARQNRRRQELLDDAARFRDSVSQDKDSQSSETIALGVLPSLDNPLTELPKSRFRAFVDHLTRVISRAAEIHLGNVEPDEAYRASVKVRDSTSASTDQLSILGNCCALCRGKCCLPGANHAFIHPNTIVSFMKENPALRPRDVFQAYVSRLGFRSISGSCVYHGEQGCGLPRSMRSDVCNGYLCNGADEVLDQLEDRSITKVAAIAADEIGTDRKENENKRAAIRKAIIDRDGIELFDCTCASDGRSDLAGMLYERN